MSNKDREIQELRERKEQLKTALNDLLKELGDAELVQDITGYENCGDLHKLERRLAQTRIQLGRLYLSGAPVPVVDTTPLSGGDLIHSRASSLE